MYVVDFIILIHYKILLKNNLWFTQRFVTCDDWNETDLNLGCFDESNVMVARILFSHFRISTKHIPLARNFPVKILSIDNTSSQNPS